MRPLRLEIEGLTAFRAKQEVDFTELDLFVVTGPTGAGKSTILDALVFALYGAIPRMTTGPSALVTHGATMAKVTLEFAADGETFQVTRRLPKRGAQKATLHRRVGEDWFTAVDDDGVRAVNARIEAIVGLDFDGFTRAVLLPQGKFAEFLRGKPEQRREILVRLLDLGRYERAAQRARDEANRIASDVTATVGLIERQFADATEDAVGAAEAAVEAAQARREALTAAEERAGAGLAVLAEIAQRRAAVDVELRAIDDAAGELRAVDERWLALAPRQAESDGAYASAAAHLETAEAVHGQAQQRLEETLAETGGDEALAALKAACAGLGEAREALARAEGSIAAARRERDDLERSVAAAADTRAKAEAADAVARAGDAEIRGREQAAAEGLRRAESSAAIDVRVTARRAEVDGHRTALAAQDATVREAVAALAAAEEQDRHARVGHEAAHLRAGLAEGQPCPVCLQQVALVPEIPEASSVTVAGAALKAAQAAHRLAENTANATRAELQAVERMLADDEVALSGFIDVLAIDVARTEFARVRTELEAATGARISAEAALRAAVEEHGRLAAGFAGAQARLAGHDAAGVEARNRIAAAERTLTQGFPDGVPANAGVVIEARLAACRDARTHEAAARKEAEAARRSLAAADRARRALEAELSRLGQDCAGQRAILAAIARRVDAGPLKVLAEGSAIGDETAHLLRWTTGAGEVLGTRVEALDAERVAAEGAFYAVLAAVGLTPRLEAADRGLGVLRKAARVASDDAVRGEAQHAAMRQKLADRQRLEEGIAADRARQQLYAALATELRRDRFLDFLLSESVDRLAAIASDELRRISNDRYSLKSDETSFVVIDHANADETRSVETLSGGETFLASLSLATALARSITDIAGEAVGSRLEAMFIDEGFGTLDDESLDAVIDALERLREADRLVGVITHVAQLAERIPDGLRVERRGSGSVISPRDAGNASGLTG